MNIDPCNKGYLQKKSPQQTPATPLGSSRPQTVLTPKSSLENHDYTKYIYIKWKFELDFYLNLKTTSNSSLPSTTSRVKNDIYKFIFRTYLRLLTYFFNLAPAQPFILFISLQQNFILLQLMHTYIFFYRSYTYISCSLGDHLIWFLLGINKNLLLDYFFWCAAWYVGFVWCFCFDFSVGCICLL